MGLDVWAYQALNGKSAIEFPSIHPFPNEDALKQHIHAQLKKAQTKVGRLPKVLVMGALGRCGTGACDFARAAGIPEENIIKWDMAETAKGGNHNIHKRSIQGNSGM